jgi:hypothetical protein
MKAATNLFTALMVLAVAQTVTKALGIVLLICAVVGAVTFPRQTFGLMAAFGLLALADRKPAYCIAAVGTIGVACVVTGQQRTGDAAPLLLPPPRHPEP